MVPLNILHALPDLAFGGGQQLVLRNIRHMDRQRFCHFVCHVRSHGELGDDFRAATAGTLDLALPYGKLAIAARIPGGYRSLVRFISDRQVHLVHTNNTVWDMRFGQFAALRSGRPVVNQLHTMVFGRQASRRARMFRRVMSRAIRHTVAVSDAVRRDWLPLLRDCGVSERSVTVVYPGLDLAGFPVSLDDRARTALCESAGIDVDDGPLLFNAARLDPPKGQDHLLPVIEAVLDRYPRARLLIAGEGAHRAALEASIAARGLGHAVRLLGMRSDMRQLLALCDLFLFPSLSEGFGLAPLEAMAAATPVVCSRLPSIAEFVEQDGCGRLVTPGSVRELTAATLDLLADRSRLSELGQRGRAIVQARFELSKCVQAMEQIYTDSAAG